MGAGEIVRERESSERGRGVCCGDALVAETVASCAIVARPATLNANFVLICFHDVRFPSFPHQCAAIENM